METTSAASPTQQHPIRLVVNDDLQRTRLTVFFRLILAIPLLLWAILWAVIALLAWLVNEVVESPNLAERAAELAAELAALPTRAVGMTKRLFDHAEHATLDEQLALEAKMQAEATQTADFREGVAGFLEKREPRFDGL